ncbi:hypothetical protein [Streptomyces noursei]|uniref:hypothetical protein n=1 Tax=Streptomyces noursei TaxID=1971 RepID=UPI0038298F74
MYDYTNVSDEIRAHRDNLADKVRQELMLAGIPAFRRESPEGRGGAHIEVDLGDDAAGGVFVNWETHPDLSQAACESVRNGQLQAPAIRHSGTVALHMRDAIIGILVSAGLQAEVEADDMRPLTVRVWGDGTGERLPRTTWERRI